MADSPIAPYVEVETPKRKLQQKKLGKHVYNKSVKISNKNIYRNIYHYLRTYHHYMYIVFYESYNYRHNRFL